METRIVKTKYWQDTLVQSLPKDARLLFVYLITCPYIGKTGYFEVNSSYILIETGLNQKELEESKKLLTKVKRAFFFKNWVYIPHALKHNRYDKGLKTSVGYQKELESLPSKEKEILDHLVDSSIGEKDTTTGSKNSPLNHKSQIINHKSETINTKALDKLKRDLAKKGIIKRI